MFQVPADAFSDVDSATLTYTATLSDGSALPPWLTFDALTRTFSGTPPANATDTFDLTVVASDGSFSASDTFRLTVTPVNDAPVVGTPVGNQSIAEDTAWTFQVPVEAFVDVDSSLIYTATMWDGSALPAWLAFDGATRTFSGTPPQNFNGSIDLKVTASDGSYDLSDTFTLTVTQVNDALVAMGIADQSAMEDIALDVPGSGSCFCGCRQHDPDLHRDAIGWLGLAVVAVVRCRHAHVLRHAAFERKRHAGPQGECRRRRARRVRYVPADDRPGQ